MNRATTQAVTVAPGHDDVAARPRSVRAAYHVHTSFSYDSRVPPEAVLEQAVAASIDVLCVTDHDTIDGAVKLQSGRCPEVKVVVGCELTSEDGSHVIGLNLRDMIPEKELFAILEGIKLQGGLVLLPHPFRRGSGIFRSDARRPDQLVKDVLTYVDIVECFNGRDSYENNQRSYRFALTHDLPAVAGSDAHFPGEVGSVFVEYFADDFVHGVSPHRVWFPSQAPRRENPAKRKLMELYHGRKDSLPPVVTTAYRALKRWTRRDSPRTPGVSAPQYEFPVAGARHHPPG
ncbi:PHP domain-containing protein [Anaeromyxobacter terrae]|uniref:PHP domain-containing protein n=1 Tax=Anaeromyxobacter terrae TaxID=2925406 RepID=UPI001F580BD2|nr:PHP domain-containing protein [Anaeromyxobacter sp. SG22]